MLGLPSFFALALEGLSCYDKSGSSVLTWKWRRAPYKAAILPIVSSIELPC